MIRILFAMALLSIVSFVHAFRATGNYTTAQGPSILRIHVLGCSKDAGEVPKLSAWDFDPNHEFEPLTILESSRIVNDYLLVSRASNSYIMLKAQTTHCFGDAALALIPGVDRHVSMVMSKFMLVDAPICSVAGTLPFDGLQVAIEDDSPRPERRIVVTDGAAYYVDHLWPRKYVLKVYTTGGLFADFDLDLSRAGTGERCTPHPVHVIKHISLQELRSRLGSGTKLAFPTSSPDR